MPKDIFSGRLQADCRDWHRSGPLSQANELGLFRTEPFASEDIQAIEGIGAVGIQGTKKLSPFSDELSLGATVRL